MMQHVHVKMHDGSVSVFEIDRGKVAASYREV